jgi:hypothetical protein
VRRRVHASPRHASRCRDPRPLPGLAWRRAADAPASVSAAADRARALCAHSATERARTPFATLTRYPHSSVHTPRLRVAAHAQRVWHSRRLTRSAAPTRPHTARRPPVAMPLLLPDRRCHHSSEGRRAEHAGCEGRMRGPAMTRTAPLLFKSHATHALLRPASTARTWELAVAIVCRQRIASACTCPCASNGATRSGVQVALSKLSSESSRYQASMVHISESAPKGKHA